ncbi:MAG: cysteine desulfurase family protein [Phycisphaerae bacterium]
MSDRIYLDNNATTQPHDEVVQAMLPLLSQAYANPSSVHQFGQAIRHRVECARQQVANLLGAAPREIIFTSGGTESINLAIRGTLALRPTKRHVVTSAVEHSATKRLCERLAREGYRIDEIGADQDGRLNLDQFADCICDETALVSLIWANNETGVLADVDPVAALTTERGVPLHLDAVQAIGKVPIDVTQLPVQLLSLSGHKFHGPKGAGALYVRRGTRLRPGIIGGRQERDLRGGTENTPGIVGLGVAAELALARLAEGSKSVGELRDRLERGICRVVPETVVIGGSSPRLDNTANIAFPGLQAEAILMLLSENNICASAGSACSSGSLEPSHVLQAMGIDPRIAHGAVRFSLSEMSCQKRHTKV